MKQRIRLLIFLILALGAEPILASDINYDEIFFEHPSGEFDDSLKATIAAVVKLYKHEKVDRWLTLSAQGAGYINHPVKIKRSQIMVEGSGFDVSEILRNSNVPVKNRTITRLEGGAYDLSEFNAEEVGRIIYSIYLNYYKVKPFSGDPFFAIGGEWR